MSLESLETISLGDLHQQPTLLFNFIILLIGAAEKAVGPRVKPDCPDGTEASCTKVKICTI
jgi:hypothetical protein